MKKIYILALLMALTITVNAQDNRNESVSYQSHTVQRGIDNYLKALSSDNTGVVESAIINVVRLKMVYTERDYSKIIMKLEWLSQENSDQNIRRDALMAFNILK